MENICNTWLDELDWNSLNENGNAILKRRYTNSDRYLTPHDEAFKVAVGITAFLYSHSYSGGLQLPPLNFQGVIDTLDISKYFQQYFEIRKKFYLLAEKSKPDSVHRDLEKEFISIHIKQEKDFYKSNCNYFTSVKDINERKIRENYVKSYLKWIKTKRNPFTLNNYFELAFWSLLCLFIIFLTVFELFWTAEKWNFVQKINKVFTNSDELQKQIVTFLVLGFISSFSIAFIRLKKILRTHRII